VQTNRPRREFLTKDSDDAPLTARHARQMVCTEEVHASDVDRMLERPGNVVASAA
jgi:hypothetical protein